MTTFPQLTEEQIERLAEIAFDVLDNRFLRGRMTQAEYDAKARQIAAHAEAQYAAMKAAN